MRGACNYAFTLSSPFCRTHLYQIFDENWTIFSMINVIFLSPQVKMYPVTEKKKNTIFKRTHYSLLSNEWVVQKINRLKSAPYRHKTTPNNRRAADIAHLDAEGLMDVCSELSFPPFQLSLHLSHPEETSRNEFHLQMQMCAELIHRLMTSRGATEDDIIIMKIHLKEDTADTDLAAITGLKSNHLQKWKTSKVIFHNFKRGPVVCGKF